jgi:aspartate/methionine/tyrosine aminotransferase
VRRLAGPLSAARRSGIGELSRLAVEIPAAIRLEVGEPDFEPPAHVLEAARQAIGVASTATRRLPACPRCASCSLPSWSV